MDPVLVVAVVLAILLAIAGSVALERGRTLDELRAALRVPVGVDLPGAVRRLVDRSGEVGEAEARGRRELAFLAELLGVGIIRLADDLTVDFANTAAHALLERSSGSLVGLTVIEAFVDGRIEETVRSASVAGAAAGEISVRGADGPRVVVRARTAPTGGVWVVLEDVSELRRLQRIRAEFVDNLSHELRTPLTTVSLLAETLLREADTLGDAVPPRMRDRIGKIEVETGHLVQMVNELLDLTRIESGAAMVHLDDVDLGRLATAAADRLRLFAERQGVRVGVDVAPGLPPVRGDEERLAQVFVNLLHNAVKFSPDGGDVEIRVGSDGEEVVVAIEDHGIGIPRAALDRVFERFYKVDRARVRGGGTGLGLSIARHVIEQHGGRIWVESEEGRGSTFSFALPVAALARIPAER